MKKPSQPPKQKPNHHTTGTVDGLLQILREYSPKAKVYSPQPECMEISGKGSPDLVILEDNKVLAVISLTGY